MSIIGKIKEWGFGAVGLAFRASPWRRSLVQSGDRFKLSRRPIPRMVRGTGPKFQILVYHRVLPRHDPFAISPVTEAVFDRQMGLLRSCYRVISLDQLADELDSGGPKPGTVCVTFDDGYKDNRDHAWPILRKHGIPATVFLATGFIGTGEIPWYDKVMAAMRDTRAGRLDFEPAGLKGLDISGIGTRAAATYGLLEWLKGFPPAERDAHIRDLAAALGSGTGRRERTMLDWDEVKEMRRGGVGFGAHTVTHPILSRISPAEMDREIGGSKSAVEDALQERIRHFAYPNGRAGDFDAAAMGILEKHGFATAVTTITGVNLPGRNRYELLRRQAWEENINSFHFRMVMERLAS